MDRWIGVRFSCVLLVLWSGLSPAHAQSIVGPGGGGSDSGVVQGPAATSARRSFEPYSAPAGCPGRSEFVARVAAWLRTDAHAIEARLAEVDVTIRESGGRWVGVVRSIVQEGTPPDREFSAADCATVVNQLSLAAAQTLNPGLGQSAPPATPTPQPLAHGGTPYAGVPSWGAWARPGGAQRPAPARPRQLEPSRPPLRWIPAVGADFVLATGFARAANVGGALRLALTREGFGAWAPAAWIALTYLLPSGTDFGAGIHARVSIDWVGVVLGGCPAALGTEEGWSFRPCATLDLGRSRAVASGTQDAVGINNLWSALGIMARLARRLGRELSLEADLGLALPLTRWEYQFQTQGYGLWVYTTPSVALRTGLGVSWSFR